MPRWSDSARRLRWPAVGALLGVLSLAEWLIEGLENSLALAAPGVLVAALLAVCPRWPAATAVLGASSVLVNLLGGAPGPGGAQFVGMGLLVGHAVAVLPRRRASGAAGAAVVVATVLGSVLAPNPWESIFYVLVLGAASAVGALVAQSRRRAAELQVLAARLAAQQEAVAAAAVVAERSRIAREVHDSVAHSVSVMVLQMGGLRRLLPDQPQAQEVLLGLERLGREAVDEMRRVVGILRDGDGRGHGAAPAPQPSLSRLDAVLDELRAGGLPVELSVTGTPRELPPLVDVSAVRVVQEALSNVLRHAGGAATAVELRYTPERVTVTVTDDGRRRLPPPEDEDPAVGGHGQLHMRERVAVAGGALEVGPVRGGGYRVRASFPVPATVPRTATTVSA
ncbi:Signal transduction histidine kinase [Blastococcus aggregatus]|uniref:histidine kinase n=1 Tax=Blastococcus aggregatus TaxID=38502 RepID=A0A285V3M6_9ACTN|nr:histidine kinase [Blastococcus aggregatus]SOC47606.1 Signal transduction histidine kinase [Blastococcus aggregatus]